MHTPFDSLSFPLGEAVSFPREGNAVPTKKAASALLQIRKTSPAAASERKELHPVSSKILKLFRCNLERRE
jgi:hypothetical protein